MSKEKSKQAEADAPKPPKPPKGFTKAKRGEYLDMVREGMRPGAAALAMGIDRGAMLAYLEQDDELAEQVRIAELEATEIVEEALFQAAASGNVPASRVWLEMRGRMPTSSGSGGYQKKSDPPPIQGDDPFGGLDNVTPIDPRRRTAGA